MRQKFQYKDLKKQKKSYSGKKKTHTFKVQAIIHYRTQQILSLSMSRGAVHDFKLFKRNLNQVPVGAFILADKGYQGIYAVYPDSLLPSKAKKGYKLDPELNAYSCINVPPILVRTVPAISVPNVPLAIFKEYWD